MGEPAPRKDTRNDCATEKAARLRFITATSLFDGHDAAINIIRRILQSEGAEVIHLGHNRTVNEIVTAAIQEDVDGIALSSYQGGHMENYKFLVDQLTTLQAASIKVFGGGGGVIQPDEIKELQQYGVTRIYSPEDGLRMGLKGMIKDMMRICAKNPKRDSIDSTNVFGIDGWQTLASILTQIEYGTLPSPIRQKLNRRVRTQKGKVPILGITGPGGAGKSSLTDELIGRFRIDFQDTLKIAILAIDPSRVKTGGALLGDRIRMNAIDSPNIFMRSMATREASTEIPLALADSIDAMLAYGFDLIIVETPGIGQGAAGIVPLVDLSLYVMTSEFGAGTQLEKVSMLDFADLVVVNKLDRRGSIDALQNVQKQMQRNREAFSVAANKMPVYGSIASHIGDHGTTMLYQNLRTQLVEKGLRRRTPTIFPNYNSQPTNKGTIIPASRQRYLAEIVETVRSYRKQVEVNSQFVRDLQRFIATKDKLESNEIKSLDTLIAKTKQSIDERCERVLKQWHVNAKSYRAKSIDSECLDQSHQISLTHTSLSGLEIPKVALPEYHDHGDILKWLMLENLPGFFPYTAGVFPFKRIDEDPTRMFAGEGDPFCTNRRFKYLVNHSETNRLSTAFDSVTLYGCDPNEQPDVYGKIGNSGVSVATLDDMKALYDGFDLCDPKTSVSMTINGPAPTILAMFFNTAIDQRIDRFETKNKRPPNHQEYDRIKLEVLKIVRGTVQADILKEDQGQNTCIFSTEFSLKIMGDIQEYFIQHQIRHFYSISVSGYHIAEAGANPITQLAFTLANGFTYIEAFLARGMAIDEFAHRLSFFFSNGMDPEYTVIGRVARRIWAITLHERYGAKEQSQKLKYHIQTSGRSLHTETIDFNEIRTTLQALIAIYDNCNSLHTNAKDEALTTPTEETVRSALAIQMIINKEWGLANNENPNQGSFIIEHLTDLVEQAVLMEFERLSERGGVLGAMETGYQRRKIQEESMIYEASKHDGSLPIVGLNFSQTSGSQKTKIVNLARSTKQEKNNQIRRLKNFKTRHKAQSKSALDRLQLAALRNKNIFAQLMDATRVCSLGQITNALFEVGGKYRRNM